MFVDQAPPAPLPGMVQPDARVVPRSRSFAAWTDGPGRLILPLDNVIGLCFSENIIPNVVKESDSPYHADHRQSIPPSGVNLPPDLTKFLESQRLACLLIGTERGSGFVVKAPGSEIEGLRRPMPVLFRQELYRHTTSPVIRLLLRLYDRPHANPPSSLAFESFVNVDDEGQRQDYGELARQDLVDLHFYDEALQHRLTKQITNNLRSDIPSVLATALRLRARIPHAAFDFDQAKADVIARTSL